MLPRWWVRSLALAWTTLAILAACNPDRRADFQRDWNVYKQSFVSSEGAVIDTGNRGVSHSEGQGYGMLLALAARDRPAFETIWAWTQNRLAVRTDPLFMWRHQPGVALDREDHNNATDGDLLIAWALLRADAAWQVPGYASRARAILAEIAQHAVRPWGPHSVLLPGLAGFDGADGLVVNLSYWIFPALREFQRVDPNGPWAALDRSGRWLIDQARYGRWKLPPDWLLLGRSELLELAIAPKFPPRFGYDAVRIPLHLAWAAPNPTADLGRYSVFWQAIPGWRPNWTNLLDDSIDSQPPRPGIGAVAALLAGELQGTLPHFDAPLDTGDYYSASLQMLSRIAAGWAEP